MIQYICVNLTQGRRTLPSNVGLAAGLINILRTKWNKVIFKGIGLRTAGYLLG